MNLNFPLPSAGEDEVRGTVPRTFFTLTLTLTLSPQRLCHNVIAKKRSD